MSDTSPVPSRGKRGLEVVWRRAERMIRGQFIYSLCSVDELREWGRRPEVSDPVNFHDIWVCISILDNRDNTHLRLALGALKRIYFVDSFDARGPRAPAELTLIVALCLFL